MDEVDPLATQRTLAPDIAAELADEGFGNPDLIGKGGFGAVYRCRQPELDRTVAIKVLSGDLDDANRQRFLREQRAMGRLSMHPNIVTILQVGATRSGRPYLVMQYHPLDSLDAQIRRTGALDWREVVHLGIRIADALGAAHAADILHRDVKPGNILVTDYGEPQLTDFGIAQVVGGFHTTDGAISGSPAFTAPEVLSGQPPSVASDLYGLGSTLFCAATGHAAFERRRGEQVVAQFLRIANDPTPALRGHPIPDALAHAIEHAMARDPADRPASAAEFEEELRAAQRSSGIAVEQARPPAAPPESTVETGGAHATTTHPSERSAGLTPPAPATRFRPPLPPRERVPRARLIEALRGAGRPRLTVIHGPAGFGKSTLAAQWSATLAAEGVAVGWLTIDRDDNNVVWFLAHLIEALRPVRPRLATELGQILGDHGEEADRYVLTSLINEIHQGGQPLAVFVDDWHRVTDTATIAAMDFLLERGCHHLPIVVTSRSRSGLPTSRMRVQHELVEIDATALRFDPDETAALLAELGGVQLDREDIDELTRSTDGWVAALQLASLSLRGHGDPAELIGHISGRHRGIAEFLTQNVLDMLEPEMLDFLLTTSITERTCAELAALLAGVERGGALLEEAEERDLFLTRLDEEGEWFRYHHIFAEFLRRRLDRDHPGRAVELHRTAAEWFAARRLLSEAVDHWQAAGDEQRAVDLVERDGTYLLEHSQMTTMLGLVAKLPQNAVAASPRLQLHAAWANILLQRTGRAKAALGRARAALTRASLDDDEVRTLTIEADVVTGVATAHTDRVDGIDDLLAECLAHPDGLRPWVVSAAGNLATYSAIYRFDFAEARRRQQWAAPHHERTVGKFSAMYGHCLAGIAAREQLDIAGAEAEFRAALRLARRSAGARSHAAQLAGALLGEILYERNRIDEASRLLDESGRLGNEGGIVEFMLARFAVGARVLGLRGDRAAAAHLLDIGAECADTNTLPRLRARVDYERVLIGVRPDTDAVTYETRRHPRDGIEQGTAQLEDARAIVETIAGEQPGDLDAACRWAREWVEHLEPSGRELALLHGQRLLAGCLAVSGRTDEARVLVARVAARCAGQGMVRFLADGRPSLGALVRQLRADEVPPSFVESVLAAIPTPQPG
ncbi:MAG TPA: protein kinase [Aldersonia sp.]